MTIICEFHCRHYIRIFKMAAVYISKIAFIRVSLPPKVEHHIIFIVFVVCASYLSFTTFITF